MVMVEIWLAERSHLPHHKKVALARISSCNSGWNITAGLSALPKEVSFWPDRT
jgi:hypothetical protein